MGVEDLATAPVVVVEDLAKRYGSDNRAVKRYGLSAIRDEVLGRRPKQRPILRAHERWVLQDISFTLNPGEALGVVGHNGAGKTTLLRLLQGVSSPDWGSIAIQGRSTALIELGSAFDSYATGRQAIATEGVLLGYTPERIRDLESEVIGFAELDEVIDTPIRTYSLGMRMRLGYAIAAYTEPDLLIIDEVLAVGDAAFQLKCVRFVLRHLGNGGSLVLVSHDPWQIRSVCTQCIVLDKGRIIAHGNVQQALKIYIDQSATATSEWLGNARVDGETDSPGSCIEILSCSLAGPDGGPAVTDGDAILTLEVDNAGPPTEVRCMVALGPIEVPVAAVSAITPIEDPLTLPAGRSSVNCIFERLALRGATYALRVAILPTEGTTVLGSVGWDDEPMSVTFEEPPDEDQTPFQIAGFLGVLRPRVVLDDPPRSPPRPVNAPDRPTTA